MTHASRLFPSISAVVVALAVATGVAWPAPASAGSDHLVEITEFAFAPAELTITAGETVTWTNLDPVVHTATSTSAAFDSGDLDQGESYSFTFTTPGTYDYLCAPHPSMTGRIVVVAAAEEPDTAETAAPTPGADLPDVAVPAPTAHLPLFLGVTLIAAAVGAAGALNFRRR